MNTKELTTAEIAFITKEVNKNLETNHCEIVLSKDQQSITVTINNTEEKLNWYSFHVTANNKEYRFMNHFSGKAEVLAIVWSITFQIWNKIDGNPNSNLAKILWSQNNRILPDYKKFLENKNY